jgi:hypothetical protein
MTTKSYLESLLDMSGHLNQFPNKSNDIAPDYGGYIKIDDKIYRLSAWIKSKNGKKSLSIKAIEADINGNISI